jgi:F-type H+-transporting ATPase subunit gamma
MNLREVKSKIKSFTNVKKITKAMQLVSSVKMRKAQKVALDSRPYRESLENMIKRVAGTGEMKESTFVVPPKNANKRELLLLVSSNKGLSGSFLTSLHRYLLKRVDYDNTDFISVGKKGATFLAITKGKIIADFSSAHPIFEVGAMFQIIKEAFVAGTYSKVNILYNKFINTLKFETTFDELLPVELSEITDKTGVKDDHESKEDKRNLTYKIEPLSTEVVNALLESYVEEKIRGALVDSEASEHSARMIAMKNATDNATDLIYSLTLEGNKLRQEKITSELLDMITAKESVEN